MALSARLRPILIRRDPLARNLLCDSEHSGRDAAREEPVTHTTRTIEGRPEADRRQSASEPAIALPNCPQFAELGRLVRIESQRRARAAARRAQASEICPEAAR